MSRHHQRRGWRTYRAFANPQQLALPLPCNPDIGLVDPSRPIEARISDRMRSFRIGVYGPAARLVTQAAPTLNDAYRPLMSSRPRSY